jgi:flagellar FliL protein
LALSGFLLFTTLKAPKVVTVVAAEGGEHGGEHGDKDSAGPVVAFDPFVINLNEPGSNRYLKTSLELEVLDKKSEEMVTERKRVVRDELLRYLSNLNVAETLGEENKTKIKTALLARADQAVGGKGKVRNVFLTEFVVQ